MDSDVSKDCSDRSQLQHPPPAYCEVIPAIDCDVSDQRPPDYFYQAATPTAPVHQQAAALQPKQPVIVQGAGDNQYVLPSTSNAITVQTADGPRVLLLQPGDTVASSGVPYLVQQQRQRPAPRPSSYAWHIALSCCTFWCCCWPLGLIAFVLAMCAVKYSKGPDQRHARRLGISSLVLSLLAAVVGVIVLIIFICFETHGTSP